jgi:antitoxin VapB
MTDQDKNAVRDMRQAFDLSGAAPTADALAPVRRVKVFKSGNSLAVRMPKGLGLEAGMELELNVNANGALELRKIEPPKAKLDISGFWGKAKGIKLAPRRDFDERPSTIAAREAALKASQSE